jgi:3-oxoacyl-[acyl-carrier-protein] synthase III
VEPKLARRLGKRASNDEIAQELGIEHYAPVQIPWIMSRTGFNNISAGTSLVAMVTMIEEGLIKPKDVLPVFGYGIGSVIQADVWKFDA